MHIYKWPLFLQQSLLKFDKRFEGYKDSFQDSNEVLKIFLKFSNVIILGLKPFPNGFHHHFSIFQKVIKITCSFSDI